MGVLWSGISAARSVAYFKEALDKNSTASARNDAKDPNRPFSDRLVLSGIIAGSSLALFGRAIYRKAKGFINKKRKERAEKPKVQTVESSVPQKVDYSKEGVTLAHTPEQNAAITAGQAVPADFQKEPEEATPINTADLLATRSSHTDSIDDLFNSDIPPELDMEILGQRLKVIKFVTTKIDRPNCVMASYGGEQYYINGSGIFDRNHNADYIKGENETLALTKLIQGKPKAVIGDFFSIFESFNGINKYTFEPKEEVKGSKK